MVKIFKYNFNLIKKKQKSFVNCIKGRKFFRDFKNFCFDKLLL